MSEFPVDVTVPSRDPSELGADLADAVGTFRRAIRRVVRQRFADAALPPSEAELLAFVKRSKGTGVGEAAQALQLAPNTVSTLVGRLVGAGLLERRDDRADRRAARLHLTLAGHARVRHFRRQRDEVLQRALATLDDDERVALAAALPALRRLTASLEHIGAEEARR